MPARPWIALFSLWPGLAQIWTGQELLGIFFATLFTLSVNACVISTCIWTSLIPASWFPFCASLAATTWLAAMGYTIWWGWRCHPDKHRVEIERLFRESFELYLQGRWSEARARCEAILARDETDADCLFQLGLIYAHGGHPELARQSFRQCLDLESGARWRWEIGQTLKRLDAAHTPESPAIPA